MAKILDKDPATYSKERDGFLRDLQHFHETRGTPFKRNPTIGGKEIDLFLLYNLVTAQGGWLKVNSKNSWPELLEHFHLPTKCVNGSVALKQTYLRYLDRWEKVHFLGEEADRGSDDDEESRHKRWSARALHSVPLAYNYHQHNIADTNREYNHLSTNLYKPSDYDRLALSLVSPLPNEQDFAINVCTLLSNDGKHTLKLEKHPRILYFLLGHAGVYNHSSLGKLFHHYYAIIRKHSPASFWPQVVEWKEALDLINESVEKVIDPKKPQSAKVEPSVEATPNERICEISDSDSDSDEIFNCDDDVSQQRKPFKFKPDPSDRELFCLGRTLGTQDYLGQRVLQVATILRNLSFIEDNVPVLVKNKTFLRFCLLCASSQWNYLKNLGYDMLGNIASDFVVKELQSDRLASILVKFVTDGLHSEDRLCCISSLEVLNKLSQNEKNEDTLLRCLEGSVYKKVCSFLTIHDVMLLIYTLECLYSLSSLGERSCNFIVNNHGVIDTLVSLVTVEGKSYGPKACIGMKLVETVPGGATTVTQVQNNATSTTASNSPVATTVTMSTSSPSSTTTTTIASSSGITTSILTTVNTSSPSKTATSTPVRTIQMAPQRILALSPAASPAPTPVSAATPTATSTSQSLTPQQIIQQQHAHQQAIHENEQFALAWLRATYEPCSTGRVDHQELYKHYINSCTKIGRRGVISPLHFPRCVRSVFGGTVGPNPVKPSNPSEPQYYDGIKVRQQPLLINIQQTTACTTTVLPVAATPKSTTNRRKQGAAAAAPSPIPPLPQPLQSPLTVLADAASEQHAQQQHQHTPCPASPILKAQLSAPPKQRDAATPASATIANKVDLKSQVMAHPHLSQALLGTSSSSGAVTVTNLTAPGPSPKDNQQQQQSQQAASQNQSNTSLIKSLLATKVNDCMTTESMRTADCQNVAQVAARQQQQRLLAQQTQPDSKTPKKDSPLKSFRMNGARQLFTDNETGDPSVSSTTNFSNASKGKKEPPQPPPPPLAPLSNSIRNKNSKIDNEDSDSLGNNSLASSSGPLGLGGISSTEEGDNSLTSFEGLLNGVPNLENPMNEDSSSKDSVKISSGIEITKNKPLRLADLLEKKIEKTPMLLNGSLTKDLRLGDKGVDLVENHIEKALNRDIENMEVENEKKQALKRPASDDIVESEAKRPNVNGTSSTNSPAPESESSSNGEVGGTSSVSTAAAKLFADMAADILEDEDEEQLLQEVSTPTSMETQVIAQNTQVPQIIMDNNQMLIAQPRQIIMSQPQQQILPTPTQIKPQTQTVIVQNPNQQRAGMIVQPNAGQILLSQGLQGQMQLVASATQPGQYLLQTSNTPGTYVVAQPQTAMVHGQPQTVLVAQTSQQQGTGAKTIIILQQQPAAGATHQKVVMTPQGQQVVMTPQGQQVVVTQVPRPVVHTSVSTNLVQPTVIKTNAVPTVTQTNAVNGVDKKSEEAKSKVKVIRDLSTPFVCEWGDCSIQTKFKSANEVYMHVCEAHCPKGSEEITCQWDRCDNMKRKRFSLMTHIYDKHCNTETMKQSLVKRKQTSSIGAKSESPSTSTTPHPGYAPDAALHAIKRHALEFVNPKELQKQPKQGTISAPAAVPKTGPPVTPADQDDNEGPVTKSIRLTASLILRNLVIYSNNCRRYLKPYEPHLANVALSNVESSRTIAQVLYDMNEGSNHR